MSRTACVMFCLFMATICFLAGEVSPEVVGGPWTDLVQWWSRICGAICLLLSIATMTTK